jgi:transcriptional regulator with XRE-family HTH domain
MPREEARLFPALLKHWRGRRGLSQLDLALAADVSARHVSFLETGRAQPSREMVLRLGAALDVPLRDQNVMLNAAGFAEEYPEPSFEDELTPSINHAIDRMLKQQEPFPMVVVNRRYDILRANRAAQRMVSRFIAEPSALPTNAFHLLFDPRAARRFVVDWERVAHALIARLHRESLARPSERDLAALVRSLFEYPDVPESWRQPDFSVPSEPTLGLRLRRDAFELAFFTTITAFNAPQNVTLEEVRIESYFPADDATVANCERLAREDP